MPPGQDKVGGKVRVWDSGPSCPYRPCSWAWDVVPAGGKGKGCGLPGSDTVLNLEAL